MAHANWLTNAVKPIGRSLKVGLIAERLASLAFDTIACQGLSGVAMGSMLAYEMGKGLALVRKPHERRHSAYRVECEDVGRFIVLDDFVSSGATLARIIKEVKKAEKASELVGVYLYDWGMVDPSSKTWFEEKWGWSLLNPVKETT